VPQDRDFQEKKASREREQRKKKSEKIVSKSSGFKGQTIENVRRRRERHLVKYPKDLQARDDIRNCSRWPEAQPRGL